MILQDFGLEETTDLVVVVKQEVKSEGEDARDVLVLVDHFVVYLGVGVVDLDGG